MEPQLEYGNWIRRKNLLILGLCVLAAGALALLPFGSFYRVAMGVLFVLLFATFLFPLYAYLMFSQRGGRLQEKVYNLIIASLGEDAKGTLLDIGTGNGVLSAQLARQHPAAQVVGVDYWGEDWEYSKAVCEKNARAVGVADRIRFQKGDAAALEFPAETFDGAVSNLTFHEVQSAADKRDVVREALRVVKPGGTFAFVDYFYEKRYYGPAADFAAFLRGQGLAQLEYKPLKDVMALPLLLRHPRILGRVGIIRGRKASLPG